MTEAPSNYGNIEVADNPQRMQYGGMEGYDGVKLMVEVLSCWRPIVSVLHTVVSV